MKPLPELRRENLRAVVTELGGPTKASVKLGYRNASFLSQQIGPNPSREITEKTARRYESDLGLPPGLLDRDETPSTPPAGPADLSQAIPLVADVIRLLGTVLQSEDVTLQPQRFADVAALALQDAAEHGGTPREAHIRSVVRLLK